MKKYVRFTSLMKASRFAEFLKTECHIIGVGIEETLNGEWLVSLPSGQWGFVIAMISGRGLRF